MPEDAQEEVIYGMIIASDFKVLDDKNWENAAKILKTRIRVLEKHMTHQNHDILSKITSMEAMNTFKIDRLAESIASMSTKLDAVMPAEQQIQRKQTLEI